MAGSQGDAPEVAFYYPGPVWHSSEHMKNLLLFFDGIALLVPEYLREKPEDWDPALAVPLRERGLLHLIEPEEHVDKEATEQLAVALTEVIASGALDSLASDEDTAFHELSMSRLGYFGDPELADMLFQELKERGLARETEDGVSIPMHRHVRVLVLVLLAQILRPKGPAIGLELIPATDRSDLVEALVEFLEIPSLPSAGHVVSADLETVGVDLSLVPLDEVLDFREQHHAQYKAYARNVRRFVRGLGLMHDEERNDALEERQNELADLAQDLRRISRTAWKKPASFALGAAGAVWTATSGDPLGAVLALGAAVAGLDSTRKDEAEAYSYLFSTPRRIHA